ncbi:hypothetical protein N0V93_002529 [Gnomoniopsis smithogilvyi]|uniref:Phosphoenolpyruvate phosphomutase n=1 Tax=Gnomoniopsis smithogilvyi TaxID=1191159 RepID=A0A9W8YWQ3_9PEZI|nr:hypothetical protein N0V93_002529 [Gnomoniopsis smithogilvyi]
MSTSLSKCLAQSNGRIRLLESHDLASREIVRNTVGQAGNVFHGIWISSLTQTTQLGLPDTEILSPLTRATLLAHHNTILLPRHARPLCAAFDCDSGGPLSEIPALVAVLEQMGVSMIVVEDKAVTAPGKKVNSFAASAGPGCLADPQAFARTLKSFKAATVGRDMLIGARIEALTARIVIKNDPLAEAASLAETLEDAQHRAAVYRDEGGADAIMIHSKIAEPSEVLAFLSVFRARDQVTPVVLVPSAYSGAECKALYEAGANVVIYAHHLFRAELFALRSITEGILTNAAPRSGGVSSSSSIDDMRDEKAGLMLETTKKGRQRQRLLSLLRARIQTLKAVREVVVERDAKPLRLFADDRELQNCLEVGNYAALYHKLLGRRLSGHEGNEERAYWALAERAVLENMVRVTRLLLDGDRTGNECDDFVVNMKELMEVNGKQLLFL